MSEPIVPAAVKLAAKRGFIRTTLQSYATALAGGISTTVILQLVSGEVPLVPFLVTVGVAAVSPLLAGLISYATITANGIPADYATATLAKHSIYSPAEILTDVNHAAEVVEGKA